jgi:hypothetical protein
MAVVAFGAISPGWCTLSGQGYAVGDEVDISIFYDELDPYGDWAFVETYGWVWTPRGVPVGWRPYTDGRWVFSDDYGWTWESDREWGWAPFHYGRWYFDSVYGWAWVPDTEWGPAWVAWRSGGGYVGWAPLPPQVGWRAEVGLDLGGVDLDISIAPTWWSFVEERVILEPQVHRYVVLPARNVTLIRTAPYATRYVVRESRIVNLSIPVERIEYVVGRPVPRTRLRVLDAPPRYRQRVVGVSEIGVYRPTIMKGAPRRAPKTFIAAKQAPSGRQIAKQQKASMKTLDAHLQDERSALETLHKREAASAPANEPREQIRKQQATERQALDQEQQRHRAQLDNRFRSEREGKVAAPKIQKQPSDRAESEKPPQRGVKKRKP